MLAVQIHSITYILQDRMLCEVMHLQPSFRSPMYGTLVGKEKEGKVWSKYWTRRSQPEQQEQDQQHDRKEKVKRNKKVNRR